MDKKNKGYSLIELIVVIAILAIVTTASIIGLGMINGKPADQCASALRISFTNHRLSTMGKNSASMVVYIDSEGYVRIKETLDSVTTDTKIGAKGVKIEVFYNDGSLNSELTAGGAGLTISFNRHNGSFNIGRNIDKIRISKASHVFDLKFYDLTGKVLLERVTGE